MEDSHKREDQGRPYGDIASTMLPSSPADLPGSHPNQVKATRATDGSPAPEPNSLWQLEDKYRRLHDSMMDAFASVDLTGRIIESNRAFQTMLGYTQEELSQMTFLDLTPAKWHEMESRMAEASEFFERGYSDLYEKEYRRKDGTVFPVELRAFLVRNSAGEPEMIWGIIRDITARKQAELTLVEWNQTLERRVADRTALLKQSEARFRQLAEATFESIAISENGILLDGNTVLAALHGYELHEMIGRPVMDFVAPESRALVKARIGQSEEMVYECLALRKDGSTFPVEVRACTRSSQGRSIRMTAMRDLTATKQAAAHLQSLQSDLEAAQKLGLVSEVSAGIIHQIGQPLCSMGVNLAAALSHLRAAGPQAGEALAILQDVEADVSRLRQAVMRLRALASPSQAIRVPTDFNAMVGQIIELLSGEAARLQIRVETEFCPTLPPIACDAVQLSQVVLNLLHNAFDACGARPPENRWVKVRTRPDGGGVELSVSDNGPGIPPEVLPHLFAPFFTTKEEGLGMGLRLSQTIVQSHGGSINGTNKAGEPGAIFRVFLPAISSA